MNLHFEHRHGEALGSHRRHDVLHDLEHGRLSHLILEHATLGPTRHLDRLLSLRDPVLVVASVAEICPIGFEDALPHHTLLLLQHPNKKLHFDFCGLDLLIRDNTTLFLFHLFP